MIFIIVINWFPNIIGEFYKNFIKEFANTFNKKIYVLLKKKYIKWNNILNLYILNININNILFNNSISTLLESDKLIWFLIIKILVNQKRIN